LAVSPARQAAYRVLEQVEKGGGFATELLQSAEVSRMSEADRHLATDLVMGVLRWRGELDYQLEQLSHRPLKYFDREVVIIARLGIYQIRFLERIPKAAVVNEAVEMVKAVRKRSAAGLMNAVLRKCRPPAEGGTVLSAEVPTADNLAAARRSLPEWLYRRWSNCFGAEGANALAWAATRVPPTTLRVRAGAASLEAVRDRLEGEGVKTRRARHADAALVLESGNVHASRVVLDGEAVIQDEASQLVGALVSPEPGSLVLDLCAAPGLKALQMADHMGSGRIVACDLSVRRLQTMARLYQGRVPTPVSLHLLRLDATQPLPFHACFDRVLADVPCSGTGTLARNPEIKWRLQPRDIARLQNMQKKILQCGLAVLAPHGRLIYSTCSLEPEENEQVVEQVLDSQKGFRVVGPQDLDPALAELATFFDSQGFFRTRPDLHSMDGFFAAVIERCQ
jgi:16S rRNA (cytosine967-C5)-methyltransferase